MPVRTRDLTLEQLALQLAALQRRVSQLESTVVVPITTLAPEPFDVLQEIKVVVQPADDEFIASFFDANINAQGANEVEAVENLKDVMLSTFEFYSSQPRKKLGPEPARQLAVLRQYIRKRE